jgi:hypothetical protein
MMDILVTLFAGLLAIVGVYWERGMMELKYFAFAGFTLLFSVSLFVINDKAIAAVVFIIGISTLAVLQFGGEKTKDFLRRYLFE